MVYKKHGMKKKYEAGEATQYISRKHARKKLQVSLIHSFLLSYVKQSKIIIKFIIYRSPISFRSYLDFKQNKPTPKPTLA